MRLSRFSSMRQAFCLDRLGIRGHVEAPRLASVPGAPEWVVGAYNHLGRAVAAVDVGGMFGCAPPNRNPRCLLLVESNGELLGVCADAPPSDQGPLQFHRRGEVLEVADRGQDLLWVNLGLLRDRIREGILGGGGAS